MARRGILPLALLAAVLAIAGAARASSPVERQIQELFWAISWFAIGVSIVVFGAMFWFLYRYRQSASPDPATHIHGSLKVEVVWTVVPAVILVIITAISIPVLFFTDTPPAPDTVVTVTANRFSWNFTYEDGTSTLGELWIRQGVIVQFDVTSTDVIHSFAVPELGIKIDAVPGRISHFWVQAEEPGDYLIQCAEFCGAGHYGMRAELHVFPATEARMYGPPPQAVEWTEIELRQFGPGGNWSIEPTSLNATLGQRLTLRIVNNNPDAYVFRIDDPVNASVGIPAFGEAWLNVTISAPSADPVTYGPTDATARSRGMVGEMIILAGRIVVIELVDDNGQNLRILPDPLILPKGEPIIIKVINNGSIPHNFVMGAPYENVRWESFMNPGEEVIIPTPFTFDEDASGTYWCDVPGHRSAGMEAPYVVGAGGVAQPDGGIPLFEMAMITFAFGVPVTFTYVVHHARRRDE